MRKLTMGALTSVVSAVGLLLSAMPSLIAHSAAVVAPTPVIAVTPMPTTTPIATNGTVLIAPLITSGTNAGDPSTIIRAALNSLPSVAALKNVKLSIKTAAQPFKSINDALAAVTTPDIVAVIWLEAAVDTTTTPILYFALPRRQYFESFQPLLRENTTGAGIITLPDALQLPYDPKLDAKTLTAYTQAQLFTAFADYPDARTVLQVAQTALSANKALTNSAAVAAEITFEQAFLDGIQFKPSSLDAALSSFTDLSKNGTVRSELQAYALANIAALYIDQNDSSSANDAVTSALAIDNNLIPALIDQGSLAFSSNDLTAANDSYTAVLSLDPNNIYALDGRGWSNYLQNQLDMALTDFSQAIKIDPNFIDAYINRATVFRLQSDIPSALSDVDTAVALDPNYEYAYSIRGNLNVRAEHYAAAIDDLSKAISLNPQHSTNYENRGYAWEAIGEPDKAFADYTRTISLAPTDPYAYLYRGNIYLERGDYYNAVVDESLSIQFNKVNASSLNVAYFYRAQSYRGLQRWSSALADYQKYISVTQNQGYWVETARAYVKAVQSLLTPTPTPTDVPTETRIPTDIPTSTSLPPTVTASVTLTLTAAPSSTLTLTSTTLPSETKSQLTTDTSTPTNTTTPTAAMNPSASPISSTP